MESFYRKKAMTLFDIGYKPIPIIPSSKKPYISKGSTWKRTINKECVDNWSKDKSGEGGIGLTGIHAIDFDITDEIVAKKMKSYVLEFIERPVLIRTGKYPKFLIPISINSAIDKKHRNIWYNENNEKNAIEFLCASDQYFVAFGVHPDTQKNYTWRNGISVLDFKADELPTLDEIDLARISDTFNLCAIDRKWFRKTSEYNFDIQNIKKDKFENFQPAGKLNNTEGLLKLESLLLELPSVYSDDRDKWIMIGAAVHHESAGSKDGLHIFYNWSRKSSKFKDRKDVETVWYSFGKYNGSLVTIATIVDIIKNENPDEDKIIILKEEKKNIINKLNKLHAVINISGKCKVLNENNGKINFSSVTDFHQFYSNQYTTTISSQKKKKTISKIWIEAPDRRQYDDIVFEPGKEIPGCYNLWTGFAINPVKGDWSIFKNHIYNIIADSDNAVGDWIMAWIGRIIQSPGGQRPGTSIVLRGKQGTGKGIFVNFIGEIFGRHYLQIAHSSQITGRFNSHLKDKLLVFVDEGFWAGDKRAEGVIKNIVTEPWIAIESKGMDVIRVRNHVNLIMASNSNWVIPASIEERRFFVLDINESRQQNQSYFKKIVDMMNNGGKEAMLYDFLHTDFSNINLHVFKQTQGLFEQKIHTMSPVQKYWFECIRTGNLLQFDTDHKTYSVWGTINSTKQYDDYLIFSDSIKDKLPLTPTQFGMAIKKMCPKRNMKKVRDGITLAWIRTFPTLQECRKSFEKEMKTKIEWEN